MNPNLYLKSFWRSETLPQIFVAMRFSKKSKKRYESVITPAVRSIEYNNQKLEPVRVDLSKTGDCVHTKIIDGIAHSTLVLADISLCGSDKKTKKPYRDANVMYQLGLALACRQATDVLVIKDDDSPTLFDINTVPYKTIDFTDKEKARAVLIQEIKNRLSGKALIDDARVKIAIAKLSYQEIEFLKGAANSKRFSKTMPLSIDTSTSHNAYFPLPNEKLAIAIPRLIDKQLIRMDTSDCGEYLTVYKFTEIGYEVAREIAALGYKQILKHLY